MNKQELSEIIELDFQRFESWELAPIDRIPVVDNIIKNCLEYIERYKSPYKHPFMNDKVKIIGVFPDADHSPIIYPVVDLRRSPESKAFVDFLLSDQAQLIFGRYGFK